MIDDCHVQPWHEMFLTYFDDSEILSFNDQDLIHHIIVSPDNLQTVTKLKIHKKLNLYLEIFDLLDEKMLDLILARIIYKRKHPNYEPESPRQKEIDFLM